MTDPVTRLLDLTRLTRRAGRVLTGVDRVEYAYLDELLARADPVFGLVRSAFGFILLDRVAMADFRNRLERGHWGKRDWFARFKPGMDQTRLRAEADLRRMCLDRCHPGRLGRMLARHLPDGVHYLNVGHSNFSDRVIAGLRGIRGVRIAVLVHDTIPLDYPEFQRPKVPARFGGFLRRVGRAADLVICNSVQTRDDVLRHLAEEERQPECVVAHLGVTVPEVGTAPNGPWNRSYFVALGTIEPRKNHALLLDVWDGFAGDPDAPDLLILGNRGWRNEAVLDRLDTAPPGVHELGGLPDDQVFALLQGAAGLLFPSLAEGYGLPPLEAAALGVPVLCNTLPIYQEVLGELVVYADAADRYLWATKIKELAEADRARQDGTGRAVPRFDPPSWGDHFNTVLNLI
ncbi:glycosyltransferase family 1 protein [Mesobacterium sp. TK19101]|uniref:Glycosyltransferase family 1 protein n=1 Tax=Mesobacterium hydrothermale TaxID=3111907 RepID=A0ABU6HGS1_9RHOB|nr:glycosyltransferase family 1 protein [Mesobacterium sp. TK19101]MEC3860663.1 glycosyltransferase family 1 protein [Mesobacterium sp. TK19101]